MQKFFDIYGTPIPLSSIKKFRIIQREYIYRPTYREAEKSLINSLSRKKYEFTGMQPYAAIIDESHRESRLSKFKSKSLKETVGADLVEGTIETIADKFNLRAFKSKKYKCINQAGREFTTRIEDIPALVMRNDGKASDVYKNDELFPLLGEPIAPAINMVHALLIEADQQYIFYGNGIQLADIGAEYERLKYDYSEYSAQETNALSEKTTRSLPKMPKFKLPAPRKRDKLSTDVQIQELKKQYSDGDISEKD